MEEYPFTPYTIAPDEQYRDLYHVYDNLSQTPYRQGEGIWCGDENTYLMRAIHVLTPRAFMDHLNWRNRKPTQLVSFYDNLADAEKEAVRRINQRYVREGNRWQTRPPESVRIAHVRLQCGTQVWAIPRAQMIDMVRAISESAAGNAWKLSHPKEWFVWGGVSDDEVVEIH